MGRTRQTYKDNAAEELFRLAEKLRNLGTLETITHFQRYLIEVHNDVHMFFWVAFCGPDMINMSDGFGLLGPCPEIYGGELIRKQLAAEIPWVTQHEDGYQPPPVSLPQPNP